MNKLHKRKMKTLRRDKNKSAKRKVKKKWKDPSSRVPKLYNEITDWVHSYEGPNSVQRGVYNSCPTMIHEDDYVPMDCCLCGSKMESVHDTHNPFPLAPFCYAKESLEKGLPHRSCTDCEPNVLISRIPKAAEYSRLCKTYHKEVA
jgi:hypothetical protein